MGDRRCCCGATVPATCEPCKTYIGNASQYLQLTITDIVDGDCTDCDETFNGTHILEFAGVLGGSYCGWQKSNITFCSLSDVSLRFYFTLDAGAGVWVAIINAVYGPMNSNIFQWSTVVDFSVLGTNCTNFSGTSSGVTLPVVHKCHGGGATNGRVDYTTI